ncbi:conditioned medium-induced protein 4 [Halobellus captivus]|uniref:conditioned medium-induced protein 4 n=1 Tax=Halobellus captivus TaxID=2592614 RepID=UPI0011A4276B|nr:conditioned medium-induced protein 4 [Halobellus captivus]
MDEKTAELRDLFVETTGEETVTESQSAARGSLASDRDEEAVDTELDHVIETMRERYDFASSLSTPDLRRIVRAFFDPDVAGVDAGSWSDAADAAVASSLSAAVDSESSAVDVDAETVFRARMDLHLVSDADRESPVPYERLRELVSDRSPDVADESLAAELSAATDVGIDVAADADVDVAADADVDVDADAVRRYRRVVEADLESRQANHRFRDAFTDLLTDADLSTRLAEDARRDGLKDATEDIETDVSL